MKKWKLLKHFLIFLFKTDVNNGRVCVAGGRLLRSPELGAVGIHAGRDHHGAQLRHHTRHAPEQAAVAAPRFVHHDYWLVLRTDHGPVAAGRRLRLPQIRRLPSLRGRQLCQQGLRHLPHVHQRRRLPYPHGLLSQGTN